MAKAGLRGAWKVEQAAHNPHHKPNGSALVRHSVYAKWTRV